MICPYCHNDNKYDALTCEFCTHELPMDSKRIAEIKKQKSIEKKAHYRNSMNKLFGSIIAILILISICVIAWICTRG